MKAMIEPIKPCPFCGGQPELQRCSTDPDYCVGMELFGYKVKCTNCKATGPWSGWKLHNEEEAIAAWNLRQIRVLEKKVEALENERQEELVEEKNESLDNH